jgi:hypothetical protein
VQDAAESRLEGEVGTRTSAGIIRYRAWPARRYPLMTLIVVVMILVGAVATWVVWRSFVWLALVLLGLVLPASLLLFPTEVLLDGHALHVRQLAAPRTYDLREFTRLEVGTGLVKRVELGTGPLLDPTLPVTRVLLPLPADPRLQEAVLTHLRRWVGRKPTGVFEVDDDQAPEDVALGV